MNTENEYIRLFETIKERIRISQIRSAYAVNSSLILLYWQIGELIISNQSLLESRNDYIDRLANDLRTEYPNAKGFSRRNLFDMRRFYAFYSTVSVQQLVALKPFISKLEENAKLQNISHNNLLTEQEIPQLMQQLVALVPWGHHILLLTKIKEVEKLFFYLLHTIENDWSRSVLSLQIEQNLYHRLGRSVNNFLNTMPVEKALKVQQIMKDPYIVDFLTLSPKMRELEIEKQLTGQITDFILELGKGFSFVGRQFHIHIAEKDYYIDMLFYHIRLKCFVVMELKLTEFQPEFAGKLNFYLSAVDDIIKQKDDNPSIGIILCKSKNGIEVEYALRNITKPIGVSEIKFGKELPQEYVFDIPTVEEFERELDRMVEK